jgi:uncharacterized coiled-coil protein SlyX
MGCKHCAALEEVIDELTEQLAKHRRTRRELSSTIRLLREEVGRQLDKEHELELHDGPVSQADGFAENQESNVS